MTCPCPECPKTYPDKISLKDHHRRCHRNAALLCHHCQYSTKFRYNLARHMKSHEPRTGLHGGRRRREIDAFLHCHLCGTFRCEERCKMLEHYASEHDVQMIEKSLQFADTDEFLNWKKEREKAECFRFVKKGKGKSSDCDTAWYRCFRDGFFHSRGEHKRRLKIKGSCKINSVCPCSMKVVTSRKTGAVNVQYVSTHVGHADELSRMNLSREEEASIAEKLSQRIPVDVILDSIRESMMGRECHRIHLTTKENLLNMEEAFQVNDGRLHADDRTSLEAWIGTVEDQSLVRFFKPQSVLMAEHPELLEEHFVLIMCYDSQIEMLKKFGPQCVCFDGTRGTNSYNFELTTLLVQDEKNQGFPCAFLISNRSDSKLMELFLTVIRNLLPTPITPKVLMSDMSEVYYNGWCATMPKPQHWLFCQWHVDQAWRKNLNKIGDAKKKCLVYKILQLLMDEHDEQTFLVTLEKAKAFMAYDPALSDFFRYFSANYCNNVRSWASCYRTYLGVNSNMLLESVHEVIKYIYLEGKKVKRLDRAVNVLLRFVRDKMCDQLTAKTRQLTPSVSQMRDRHDSSLTMTFTIIPLENGWLVSLESQAEVYEVNKTGTSCGCGDRCDECGVCVHEYRCTCADAMNLCQHIHLVVTYVNQREPPADVYSIGDAELIITDDQGDDLEEEIVQDLLAKNRAIEEFSHNIEQSKQKLRHSFEAILQNVENFEHVDIIEKAIATIPPTMKAVSSGSFFKPGSSLSYGDVPTSGSADQILTQSSSSHRTGM